MRKAAVALEAAGERAAFFLTAEEIEKDPELVRALYAAGHSVGVTCAEDAEDAAIALRDANEALLRVLHRKSLLALLTPAQSEFCPGYCIVVRPQSQPALSILLAQSEAKETVLLVCEDDLPESLQTLAEADAPLRQLRETSPLVLILDMPEESAEP